MRSRLWLMVVVFVILLAPAVRYLGWPLFIDKTVDAPLPYAAGPAEQISQ